MSGWNFHLVSDAADFAAVVFEVPVVVVLYEDFAIFSKKRANFGAETEGFWFLLVEHFEIFFVFVGNHGRHYLAFAALCYEPRIDDRDAIDNGFWFEDSNLSDASRDDVG